MHIPIRVFLVFLFFSTISCESHSQESPHSDFIYNLNEPTSKVKLIDELDEISGLSFLASDSLVAAVQDEKGRIYLVNAFSGEVIREIKFDKKGDYEGIEIVGSSAFILRSDGMIIQVKNFQDTSFTIEKYASNIDQPCDAEALSYSPENNCLVVACKNSKNSKQKDFWAFDLTIKKLRPKAINLLKMQEISTYIRSNKWKQEESLLLKLEGAGLFPSGLAIHPISGDWYILSSANKRLVIMDKAGSLRYVIPLYHKNFKQPEGIAFTPSGKLIISNEGKNGKANLLVFNPKNDQSTPGN